MKPTTRKTIIIICCVLLVAMTGRMVYRTAFRMAQWGHTPVKSYLTLNKLDALLNLVSSKYVEDVDEKAIIEHLIPQVLSELDPHSSYIPAKEMEKTNEEIEGSFSGVGIQFNIREDTIRVIAVVNGGPAEKAGMKAGDCIVTVEDSAFVGKGINNDLVMKTLRGKKNTKIKVGVKRQGTQDILDYVLTRDDIPVNSVDASYKIGDNIAYIKIGNFSRTTYNEFLNIVNHKRTQEGCDRLIIDLRSNPGGLMGAALGILNELLPKNRLMLYVEGKSYPREESRSDGKGSFQQMPVVVLTDEWSASASEIVAGALQDNDRAYIVGRRTYGKGLVQQQIPFKDGSAVRLTVAHYYIPSGRNIQKPYTKGHFDDYEKDLSNRYERGEFGSLDSIQVNDSLRFETRSGRIVYGGGGIIPDYFVPIDTTAVTPWFATVINRNLVYLYAANYADRHRSTLSQCKTSDELRRQLDRQPIAADFVAYAQSKGVKGRPKDIETDKEDLLIQIYAYIARNILGDDQFWEIAQEKDQTLLKAVELIKDLGTEVGRP